MSNLHYLVDTTAVTPENCLNLYNNCDQVQEDDYLVTIRFDTMIQNAQNWGIADETTCVLCGELDNAIVANEIVCYDFKKCKISTLAVSVCACYQKEQYSKHLIKTEATDSNPGGYDVSPVLADMSSILGVERGDTPLVYRYFHRFMYWSADYFKQLYALVVRRKEHFNDISIKFFSRAYLCPPSISNYSCVNDFTILCIVKNKWADIHWLNPRVALMQYLITLCNEVIDCTERSITPGTCLKKRSELAGGRLDNSSGVKRARQVTDDVPEKSPEY